MRNLRNVRLGRWSHADITSACWDPEKDEVLCTVGPSTHSSAIELVRVSEKNLTTSHKSVATWDAPSPHPDLPVDTIVSSQYLSGSGTTCLVFQGGDIVTVQEDHSSDEGAHIEIMGSIDAGIAAARWSPDEELLAIVTKDHNLIFMGSTFDPVVEVAMTTEDLKASKHVSVGWGKKETQFQGRGAKALRDPTIPEKVDEGLPSSYEDSSTTISWRGDGAFVAVNSLQEDSRRVIRVYSREGELDSASEPVDGLEGTLSWRPAGNLMAGIQRRSDSIDVVFFERNGLRHGQFTLRSPQGSVVDHSKIRLQWNSDSTVLAVALDGLVQFWTMGNYHWYLKQEIPLASGCPQLSWHPEKALRFAVATSTQALLTEYILHTTRGSCLPPYDNGVVSVIDGETVKLTPFRTANVPPPMSLFDVACQSAVVDVAFGHQNTSFAVLHRLGVDVYDMPMKNGRSTKPQLRTQAPLPSASAIPLRISCVSGNVFRTSFSDGNSVVQARIDGSSGRFGGIAEDKQRLVSISTFEDDESIEGYGQDLSGNLYNLSSPDSDLLPVRFPTHLPWFEMSKPEGIATAFGLSRSGHIYANSRLLAKSCTSFIITPSHLIFTTSNHLVKYVHLTSDVEALQVPADDPERDERCRSVERGSRLVTAIPTNMSIVLQMPRGNVETIFPRAMVVAGIRSLIDEKNYARAFSYCRTQRVDMNILYDHHPTQFLASVGLFLDQLKDVTYTDLFLSSLREEDVTQTMYQDTKRARAGPLGGTAETDPSTGVAKLPASKVNTICDALLKSLLSRKTTNLQNIITAHVCKAPPALDDGLTLVADLMREDGKVAEKAVEHICFLVDVNRVYEHALGLYNLELALLVAQQSQRDPREYLPFIQNLHALPELRRKFEIDDHLARRTKALLHLQALDGFDELCDYTTRHALYQDALKLYRYDQPRLNALTELYAAHLEATSAFREAGLAYESLQNYTKATNCYRASGATCWQECLYTAQQQRPPLSAGAMADLATSLADALWEAKDYSAAATIHADYLSSLETAVKCLCKGYHFAEAIRLVVLRSRADLLETSVDAGLAEALGSTTEFLADCKGQLLAQVPRIAELRRKAAEDPLAFYEGERAGGADIPDDVSVAASSRISTSASLFTRYTGKGGAGSVGTVGTGVSRATSKNRRREEKKRARGRKGTVYEEEYLVNSVRRLVERVAATGAEVERLVFALVRRGMAERARAAEALMADVVEACDRAVAEVFAGPATAESGGGSGSDGQDAGRGAAAEEAPAWKATGGDAVLQDWMAGRSKRLEPPVLPAMKKLALLG
ncbi:Putative elongator complex protein 1 [Purpureocillium takamizusanense]|uniref:Elongator complex protein 1 n=1 Tax=Purpureocillium takamizusanense TaxID=2060973 RepID=A0A9Q8V8S1_9HYPO|nr:Putative elongator complex protein 1 [Purpureocillium takamizusanense]UNI16144.1 Putative elongator complex protein 1 [Purpureocillium takamizusanense]